jgi:hypothetical protein
MFLIIESIKKSPPSLDFIIHKLLTFVFDYIWKQNDERLNGVSNLIHH